MSSLGESISIMHIPVAKAGAALRIGSDDFSTICACVGRHPAFSS
jgi:hypothetical protein